MERKIQQLQMDISQLRALARSNYNDGDFSRAKRLWKQARRLEWDLNEILCSNAGQSIDLRVIGERV